MLGTISGALARSLISRKTLRSLRPEIGEFAGRAGEDRAVEDRAGEDMAGQGRAGGQMFVSIVDRHRLVSKFSRECRGILVP